SHPWEVITVDLIGPLPESSGYNAILVIVDWYTKMVIALPSQVEITSEGIARELRDHVFRHHGLPRKIISDRGPQFASKYLRDLCSILGIKRNKIGRASCRERV